MYVGRPATARAESGAPSRATRTAQPVSVVIPAHQEEATIERALQALLAGTRPGELEVVVVCNGCTDATADRARAAAAAAGHEVAVLELAQASKAAALRAGDLALRGFPRLYLDADVVCPSATVRALAARLREGYELALPGRRLDLSAATVGARLYYRAWQDLPWVVEARAGRG